MEKFSLFFLVKVGGREGGQSDAQCSTEVLDLSLCGRWVVRERTTHG